MNKTTATMDMTSVSIKQYMLLPIVRLYLYTYHIYNISTKEKVVSAWINVHNKILRPEGMDHE